MGPMLRLSQDEGERIEALSLELNSKLIKLGFQPLAMSKLLHMTIEIGIDTLEEEPALATVGMEKTKTVFNSPRTAEYRRRKQSRSVLKTDKGTKALGKRFAVNQG
jgi:hypothetical protein